MGWVYLIRAAALNLLLVRLAVRLYRMPDRRQATSSLFHYSMLYLALLFLFLAVDRSMQLQNPFLGRPGAVIRGIVSNSEEPRLDSMPLNSVIYGLTYAESLGYA